MERYHPGAVFMFVMQTLCGSRQDDVHLTFHLHQHMVLPLDDPLHAAVSENITQQNLFIIFEFVEITVQH